MYSGRMGIWWQRPDWARLIPSQLFWARIVLVQNLPGLVTARGKNLLGFVSSCRSLTIPHHCEFRRELMHLLAHTSPDNSPYFASVAAGRASASSSFRRSAYRGSCQGEHLIQPPNTAGNYRVRLGLNKDLYIDASFLDIEFLRPRRTISDRRALDLRRIEFCITHLQT